MGDPRQNIICPQESNPEGYCLITNNTTFCKTIGDLCDEGGFVKPEYPYPQMTRKRIQYTTDDPDKFTLQEMTEKTEEICERATD